MNLPINGNEFNEYILKNGIFEKSKESMLDYLEKWFQESPDEFIKEMETDLISAKRTYRFRNTSVSYQKDFSCTPILDTIICIIDIFNQEGEYQRYYKAVYDLELNLIDQFVEF